MCSHSADILTGLSYRHQISPTKRDTSHVQPVRSLDRVEIGDLDNEQLDRQLYQPDQPAQLLHDRQEMRRGAPFVRPRDKATELASNGK